MLKMNKWITAFFSSEPFGHCWCSKLQKSWHLEHSTDLKTQYIHTYKNKRACFWGDAFYSLCFCSIYDKWLCHIQHCMHYCCSDSVLYLGFGIGVALWWHISSLQGDIQHFISASVKTFSFFSQYEARSKLDTLTAFFEN